jgi:hypothetical protein
MHSIGLEKSQRLFDYASLQSKNSYEFFSSSRF